MYVCVQGNRFCDIFGHTFTFMIYINASISRVLKRGVKTTQRLVAVARRLIIKGDYDCGDIDLRLERY